MKTATSYVISKTLSKTQLKRAVDQLIAPLYAYQGGKPPENLKEISYGKHQLKDNLIPKSLAYFENLEKIGYAQRMFYAYFRTIS